jgi:drug/metabolite transporter (DMT)-like permease
MTARTRGELFLLSTTVIWGSTFVAQKIGLVEMSPMLMIAMRFGLATAILLALFARSILPLSSEELRKGGILGLLLFLGFVVQTIGLLHTTASKSAFITSMMIVFAPLFQVIVERRLPTVGNVIGIAVVCLGLWLLTAPSGSGFNIGDGLTLICAVVFGLYIVYLDIVSKQIAPIRLSFLQVATCAVLAWGITGLSEVPSFSFSGPVVIAIVYLTVFATVITTLVQTRYQKDTTPTRAAIIFSIEPLFATLLAALILEEDIGTWGAVGGGLIVVGVVVSEVSDLVPALRAQVGVRSS